MGVYFVICASLFTIAPSFCFTIVSADFCEWFICHPTEQYCCGYNTCCNYFNYSTWFLWGGAVMIGLLLVVLYYMLCSPSCASKPDPESDKAPIVVR